MLRITMQLVMILATTAGARAQEGELQRLIDESQAGQTVRVTAGRHDGPLVIRRSMTLAGEPGAIIDAHEKGDAIRIEAPDVTVRGMRITGTGDSLDRENAGIVVLAPRAIIEDNTFDDVLFGIYLKKAADSVIRRNRIGGKDLDLPRRGDGIRLWYSPGCLIEDNNVHDGRDVVIWFSSNVTVRGNLVSRGRYGLHFMYCDDNTLENNSLQDNSVGAFLMYSRRLTLRGNRFARNRGPSGYGIGLKDMDGVTATGNVFDGNRIGIYFDNSPSSVDVQQHFSRNVLAFNDIALAFQPSTKRNHFSENTFLENIEQVAVLGSGRFDGNSFTTDGRGNYWSDYNGYDRGGDGVGDVPYQAQSLFENLMDREPKLRLFLFSPAQQAIEMAARTVPTIRPIPKLTDSAPLMQPILIAMPQQTQASASSLAAVAAGLIVASGLLLTLVGRGPIRNATASTAAPAAQFEMQDSEAVTSTAPLLKVQSLSKRFGRVWAVEDMSFDLRGGEALALWGDNGAGKTTAIRCILGLYRCAAGASIVIVGHDVRRHGKAARTCVGYVPQELAFYDDWKADELLCFFARIKRVHKRRVGQVLAEVGLSDHARKKVAALSGGMKQRLALAAALLADPPLLILDEITANLDAAARRSFLSLLQDQRRRDKAILFTSHRLEEITALADRVLVMQRGRVTAVCEPQQLAQTLGLQVGLRVWVDAAGLDKAVELLHREGFDARRNGRSLSVRVRPDDKGRPLNVLMTGGLTVQDFELDNHSNGEEGVTS
ncbi:MAG: nitrous oxide reductase family maturation protein NosD [Phycisphaeraceae bacterium]|nr:nitrous oxide reductase family maturation protein NosD [Phycisphaeraceae bacterium]